MNGIKYKDNSLDITNLIDYSTWTVGQSSATGFSRTGLAYENLIVSDFCPHGEIGPIWQAFNSDVDSNADGGWTISPSIDIDNSKTYRFSVWWKNVANATQNADGRFYHGVYGYTAGGSSVGIYNRSNGEVNTDAYFQYLYVRELEEGTWYLAVGHIFPAGSGTGPIHEDSGLYTKYGGKNSSFSTSDFTWHENGGKAAYRTHLFYCNNPSTIVQFAYPRIEVVDGTEPTINQLLTGFGGYPVVGATRDRNFYVKTSGDMGPSEKTHYWSMIPISGTQYALYEFDESVNKPRITVDPDSQSFITRINNLTEESITTISEAISWVDSNSKAHVDFIQTVDTNIYIDPTNVLSGRDGSIENPYNSFVEAGLTNGTTYLWKGGTTYVSSTVLDLTNKTGIIIGQYGTGAKPKFQYTGNSSQGVLLSNCTNCTLSFIDVYTDLNNSLISLIQVTGGSGNIITNCTIHNVRHKTLPEGMGIRGGGTNLKILNCEVYDCGADGMYLVGNTNLEVGYCNIHHVNQDYAGAERGFRSIGGSAGGDGIQLDGNWSNYHIHHTTIDRTDAWTGNKFCLIQSSAPTSNTNSYGLVEYCTFKTRADNNVGWGIFAGFGDGITYRYNTFLGKTAGIRVAGPASKNYLIHHNVFKECTSGVGIAYNEGSPLNTRVFNNTFYKCSLRGIWVDRTTVIARNNIYYPDGAGGVGLHSYGGDGVSITQSNCCFENQETIGNGGQGDNAIIGNPLLVDAENGDFHLQLTSSCRNAGIDVGIDEDFDGVLIPQETYPAIGAYEYI